MQFDDIDQRRVNIISEGTRMTGYVYTSKSVASDAKLPTVIMATGWGGLQWHLRPEAADLARNGYLVLSFDYRGWGESDARVSLRSPVEDHKQLDFSAEVHAIREVVDPIDMTTDWQNAIHWVHGEAQVDPNRIGLWGSSMSGSFVIYAAAHDARIKAVHSQVTGWLLGSFHLHTPAALHEATGRARGEIGYPAPGEVINGLRGAPITSRFATYNPMDAILKVDRVAIQFVLSEHEQYLNNEEHAIAAYKQYKGPKNLVILEGISHYDIYGKGRPDAQRLACAWFDRYLKA